LRSAFDTHVHAVESEVLPVMRASGVDGQQLAKHLRALDDHPDQSSTTRAPEERTTHAH
jgi:hypothetical protein